MLYTLQHPGGDALGHVATRAQSYSSGTFWGVAGLFFDKGDHVGQGAHNVVRVGVGKLHQLPREHLRHPAHPGGADKQPAGGGLEDGDAEGLGEGGVEDDVASCQHGADITMPHPSQLDDALLEHVHLPQRTSGKRRRCAGRRR